MDYVAASFLTMFGKCPPTVISYNIACQWSIYLKLRLEDFPCHLHIDLSVGEIRYAIPKYHFNVHKEKGHNQFSLNLMEGVGRTDGEEVERNWSQHDGTAANTREMGPGFCEDTLESHFDYANWRKLTGLGKHHICVFRIFLNSRFRRCTGEEAQAGHQRFHRTWRDLHCFRRATWLRENHVVDGNGYRVRTRFYPSRSLFSCKYR